MAAQLLGLGLQQRAQFQWQGRFQHTLVALGGQHLAQAAFGDEVAVGHHVGALLEIRPAPVQATGGALAGALHQWAAFRQGQQHILQLPVQRTKLLGQCIQIGAQRNGTGLLAASHQAFLAVLQAGLQYPQRMLHLRGRQLLAANALQRVFIRCAGNFARLWPGERAAAAHVLPLHLQLRYHLVKALRIALRGKPAKRQREAVCLERLAHHVKIHALVVAAPVGLFPRGIAPLPLGLGRQASGQQTVHHVARHMGHAIGCGYRQPHSIEHGRALAPYPLRRVAVGLGREHRRHFLHAGTRRKAVSDHCGMVHQQLHRRFISCVHHSSAVRKQHSPHAAGCAFKPPSRLLVACCETQFLDLARDGVAADAQALRGFDAFAVRGSQC
ncbi:hypothetical protein D3C72_1299770 [compost metagenome]